MCMIKPIVVRWPERVASFGGKQKWNVRLLFVNLKAAETLLEVCKWTNKEFSENMWTSPLCFVLQHSDDEISWALIKRFCDVFFFCF